MTRPSPTPPRPAPQPGGQAPGTAATAAPRRGSVPRRAAPPLALLGAVAGAFAYVAAVDPNQPGHYPLCPLRFWTGLYCPGCGGLRSAYAVAHGHLGVALGCNALAVAGYLLFAAGWAVWFTRALRGLNWVPVLRPAHRNVAIAVTVVFTVVRNLPFGTALAP